MRNDLKTARTAKGLTQGQLGERIGKSQAVVSRYESGESAIDVEIAPALAAALGLNVLDVLYADSGAEKVA